MLFDLSTGVLAIVLVVVVGGATCLGIAAGHRLHERQPDQHKEATGALQATLLGFVGLLLAFGLSMAVGRYETRRTTVVEEANAIGTTYLRSQTIPEPMRSRSITALRRYVEARIDLSEAVPDSADYERASKRSEQLADRLWAAAGAALVADPSGSATRLYVESLNEMIDMDTTRHAALANRIPEPVMWLQILGASIALAALALHLGKSKRSVASVSIAAIVVILILFVTFDLDRPRRGFITVPDTPLVSLQTAMREPPVVVPR